MLLGQCENYITVKNQVSSFYTCIYHKYILDLLLLETLKHIQAKLWLLWKKVNNVVGKSYIQSDFVLLEGELNQVNPLCVWVYFFHQKFGLGLCVHPMVRDRECAQLVPSIFFWQSSSGFSRGLNTTLAFNRFVSLNLIIRKSLDWFWEIPQWKIGQAGGWPIVGGWQRAPVAPNIKH